MNNNTFKNKKNFNFILITISWVDYTKFKIGINFNLNKIIIINYNLIITINLFILKLNLTINHTN